jgi:hypothetical protein
MLSVSWVLASPPSKLCHHMAYMSQPNGMKKKQEAEKKKWETAQCQAVANQINMERGADYEARCSGIEFPDGILKSASGRYPDLPVEVVSVPIDPMERDEKDSDRKIMQTLTQSLSSKGVEHYRVDLGLTAEARAHGANKAVVEQLADLLVEVTSNEVISTNRRVTFREICKFSAQLAKYFNDVFLFHQRSIRGVQVDLAEGRRLPSDGRWIEEGIRRKEEKYGRQNIENVMLVIDFAAFVDQEQISSFRAANPAASLPFSELWIVTYYDHGVFRLK